MWLFVNKNTPDFYPLQYIPPSLSIHCCIHSFHTSNQWYSPTLVTFLNNSTFLLLPLSQFERVLSSMHFPCLGTDRKRIERDLAKWRMRIHLFAKHREWILLVQIPWVVLPQIWYFSQLDKDFSVVFLNNCPTFRYPFSH